MGLTLEEFEKILDDSNDKFQGFLDRTEEKIDKFLTFIDEEVLDSNRHLYSTWGEYFESLKQDREMKKNLAKMNAIYEQFRAKAIAEGTWDYDLDKVEEEDEK